MLYRSLLSPWPPLYCGPSGRAANLIHPPEISVTGFAAASNGQRTTVVTETAWCWLVLAGLKPLGNDVLTVNCCYQAWLLKNSFSEMLFLL
jgi:hypothetical protein